MKKRLTLGLGMIVTTQEQAKRIADELVKRGELNQEESKEVIKEMHEKGKETKLELE
ncbi:phasin-related domain-containing protein [Bacillus cereus]|uniref:phasin-related domain-containing protein n=1 Tax=Bacillus cereus TaxID=1396 RepID=UPI003D6A32FA